MFWQVFVKQAYSCLSDCKNVELVIDCGANVGYSAAYLLTIFPKCKVIAIEPDASNFALLQVNLAPYKDRVKLIHAGIWSHPADLKISEEPYGDSREWARQVRECVPGESPDITGIDLGSLLKEFSAARISILKMDIEGAEAVVFSKNHESWLPYVDNMAIELHNDTYFGRASEIFYEVMTKYNRFEISRFGEVTVCKSRQ